MVGVAEAGEIRKSVAGTLEDVAADSRLPVPAAVIALGAASLLRDWSGLLCELQIYLPVPKTARAQKIYQGRLMIERYGTPPDLPDNPK